MIKIKQLWYYPFKSAAGIQVHSTNLKPYGFENDRRCMVVNEKGILVSQRQCSRMCLIIPRIVGPILICEAPGMDPLRINLDVFLGEIKQVIVHEPLNPFDAIDLGDHCAKWISKYLDGTYRIVGLTDDRMRKKMVGERQMIYSCHDSSPLHVVSTASLNDLERRIRDRNFQEFNLDIRRVRPNIVIEGLEPYEEESMPTLKIGGDIVLVARKKTPRCTMLDIEPDTGIRVKGVSQELKRYKLNEEQQPVFGMHFIPLTTGKISVGDEVVPTKV